MSISTDYLTFTFTGALHCTAEKGGSPVSHEPCHLSIIIIIITSIHKVSYL